MKYLIILLLLVIFWAIVFWRLRPYIKMAQRVLGVFRDVRRVSNQEPVAPLRQSNAVKETQPLVRCASCETWIPASRAVKLRSQSAAYCSHECLERAADAPQRARRSS